MKKIEKIMTLVGVAMMVWVGLSFVDIIADNTRPNPTHSKYNLFVMMVDNR